MKLIHPNGPAQLRKIREDCLQSIRDVQFWNTHRTEHAPMDCESERLIVAKCDEGLAAAARGDGDAYCRIAGELVDLATSAVVDSFEPA